MKVEMNHIENKGYCNRNYNTGLTSVRFAEVGIKVKKKGKCRVCGKTMQRTRDFMYATNGFTARTYEEAMELAKKDADEWASVKLVHGDCYRMEKSND